MTERYLDGNGVAFSDYRALLPKRAADFPKRRVVKDAELLKTLHAEWSTCASCVACGVSVPAWLTAPAVRWLHLHHIAHGACGRSDERTNIVMLCSYDVDMGCHSDAHGGKLSLGRLLFCRWQMEPETIDWVRLAVLFGHFLPDLEP